MKAIKFHRAAGAELDEAVAHYEARCAGLGLDFQSMVEFAITTIRQHPTRWPPHAKPGVRKCPVKRFPFTIFFEEHKDGIWIAAIAHRSRRPDYWTNRQP